MVKDVVVNGDGALVVAEPLVKRRQVQQSKLPPRCRPVFRARLLHILQRGFIGAQRFRIFCLVEINVAQVVQDEHGRLCIPRLCGQLQAEIKFRRRFLIVARAGEGKPCVVMRPGFTVFVMHVLAGRGALTRERHSAVIFTGHGFDVAQIVQRVNQFLAWSLRAQRGQYRFIDLLRVLGLARVAQRLGLIELCLVLPVSGRLGYRGHR